MTNWKNGAPCATWRMYLKTVERMRRHYVETGDQAKARELVRRAAIFARMMVNTRVETTEKWFDAYMSGKKLPGFHRTEVMAINRWAKKLDAVAFLQLTDWQQWRVIQRDVAGLGPAKAAMAVALIGGNLACIDRHVFAHFLLMESDEVTAMYKREVTAGKYQALHRRFFGLQDSARDAQWRLFEQKVPTFADSAHWPYFKHVLAIH